MDSYEAFIDEYVAFMKKYSDNPSDVSLLADYTKYMSKYADMVEKFDKWESEDLNDAGGSPDSVGICDKSHGKEPVSRSSHKRTNRSNGILFCTIPFTLFFSSITLTPFTFKNSQKILKKTDATSSPISSQRMIFEIIVMEKMQKQAYPGKPARRSF